MLSSYQAERYSAQSLLWDCCCLGFAVIRKAVGVVGRAPRLVSHFLWAMAMLTWPDVMALGRGALVAQRARTRLSGHHCGLCLGHLPTIGGEQMKAFFRLILRRPPSCCPYCGSSIGYGSGRWWCNSCDREGSY